MIHIVKNFFYVPLILHTDGERERERDRERETERQTDRDESMKDII